MSTFLIIVTKYLFILLMLFYTIECFCALKCKTIQGIRNLSKTKRNNFSNVFIGNSDDIYESDGHNGYRRNCPWWGTALLFDCCSWNFPNYLSEHKQSNFE